MITAGAIAKYAKMMTELGYSTGDSHRILWKKDDKIYATKEGADFSDLKDEDIEDLTYWDITEKEVLSLLKDMDAMVISKTPWCLECIKRDEEITAVIDDMAQIIGYKVRIVPYEERAMVRALKQSAGTLVRTGQGGVQTGIKGEAKENSDEAGFAVAVGRNPYEAYVAMTVMEKNAEVYLKAKVLGGGKKLSPALAMMERRFYLNKYSKAERKNKDEEK